MSLLVLSFVIQVFAEVSFSGVQGPLPQTLRQNEVFEFKPQAQHHFSEEAPQSCGQGQALINKSLNAIKCQFVQGGETEPVLNVCDDKKTFCKPVRLKISVGQGLAKAEENLNRNQNLNHDLKAKLTPGFEVLTPEQARKAANGRMILALISTDWCPPCNEAKEHLLPSSAFQETTANWLKVYVDGDALAAKDWDAVVSFKFYPSFVLLDSNLKEVGRFLGPIRQGAFKAWASYVTELRGDTLEKLKLRLAEMDEPSLWLKIKMKFANGAIGDPRVPQRQRLLEWALQMQDKSLIDALKTKTPLTLDLEDRYLSYLAQETSGPEKIKVLKQLLDLTFDRDGWAGALADLCTLDAKACEPYLAKVDARIKFLKEQPWTEAEKANAMAEEYLLATQAFAAMKRPLEEKRMAEGCVEQYRAMGFKSTLKLARSARQGLLACLDSALRYGEAQETVDQLIQEYPNEPTFLAKKARLYKKQKKFSEALVWAEKAEKVAYGYNWLSLQAFKAELLLELKKQKNALIVIDSALSQVQLDAQQDSRDQQVMARLRSLRLKAQ